MYSIILCPAVALESGSEPRTNVFSPLRGNGAKVSILFNVTYSVPPQSGNPNVFPHSALSPTHVLSTDRSFPALHNIRFKFNYVCHTLKERLFCFQIGLAFTKCQ